MVFPFINDVIYSTHFKHILFVFKIAIQHSCELLQFFFNAFCLALVIQLQIHGIHFVPIILNILSHVTNQLRFSRRKVILLNGNSAHNQTGVYPVSHFSTDGTTVCI